VRELCPAVNRTSSDDSQHGGDAGDLIVGDPQVVVRKDSEICELAGRQPPFELVFA